MEPFGNSTDIDTFPITFVFSPASRPLFAIGCFLQRVCRTHWNWNNKNKKTIDNQETVVSFHVLFTIFTLFSPPLKMLFMHGSVSAQVWSVTIQKSVSHTVSMASLQCLHTQLPPKNRVFSISSFPSFSFALFLYKIAHIQTLAGENSKRWSCQWEHRSKISTREEVGYRHESWKSHFLLKRRAAYS